MLCCAAWSGRAAAADFEPQGLYVAFHTGYAAPRDGDTTLPTVPTSGELEFDENVTFSGAMGINLSEHVRVESELGYRRPDAANATLAGVPAAASGDISTWTLMLNSYYDFRPDKRFNPYLSAGAGVAHHNADLNIGGVTANDSATNFAWTAGAGVSYAVNDQISLTGGYRYLNIGNPDFGAIKTKINAHELRIGITIKLQP